MKSYSLQEIKPGLEAEFHTHIEPGSIDAFQKLSGDVNPLHSDASFAKAAGFKDRVAHGMLTAGLYSRLVGHYLPGRDAILHRVDSSFLLPVFEGDELTVKGSVSAVNESVKQIEIKAEIINAKGEKVSRAKIWAGVRG